MLSIQPFADIMRYYTCQNRKTGIEVVALSILMNKYFNTRLDKNVNKFHAKIRFNKRLLNQGMIRIGD